MASKNEKEFFAKFLAENPGIKDKIPKQIKTVVDYSLWLVHLSLERSKEASELVEELRKPLVNFLEK